MRRISSPTRLSAALVLVAAALVAPHLNATSASALDTRFETYNLTNDQLSVFKTSGSFVPGAAPSNVPYYERSAWSVIFHWGWTSNWGNAAYRIGASGYELWVSGNPAYGAWQAEARCTIRKAGVIVTDAPYACLVDGTTIVVGYPVDWTLRNELDVTWSVDDITGVVRSGSTVGPRSSMSLRVISLYEATIPLSGRDGYRDWLAQFTIYPDAYVTVWAHTGGGVIHLSGDRRTKTLTIN